MRRVLTFISIALSALAASIAAPDVAHAVLSLSASAPAARTATVTVVDGPARRSDTIEIVNSANRRVAWLYLNGTTNRPRSGLSTATVTFSNLNAGTYRARLMSNGRQVILSAAFAVSDTPPPPPPSGKAIVYLTFDDGPEESGSPAIRSILDRHGVKGTFFVVGYKAILRPAEVAAIANGGHAVGNHTYKHPDLRLLSDSQIREELNSTTSVITSATGRTAPRCMRPPYGHVDLATWEVGDPTLNPNVRSVVEGLGFSVQLWTHDTRDWDQVNTSVSAILGTLNSMPTTAGSVSNVLMHDGVPNTLTALEQWLPANLSRYDFRVIPSC